MRRIATGMVSGRGPVNGVRRARGVPFACALTQSGFFNFFDFSCLCFFPFAALATRLLLRRFLLSSAMVAAMACWSAADDMASGGSGRAAEGDRLQCTGQVETVRV